MLLPLYKKLSEKLFHLPFVGFVFVILILSYVLVLPFALFDDGMAHPISERHIAYQIITGCLLAPVLETLLFQVLPIHIFTKKWIKNRTLAIFISGALFGLTHYYSWQYILWTCVIGLLYAWAYLNYHERQGFKKVFWAITIAHALRNTVALVAGVLSQNG